MRNYDSTAESVVSLLGKLFHFKTVMDVGCTEKAWLKAFKKSGAEVFGVCMVGHPVDFHEEGIRTQDIDFGSTRFNVQRKQDLALSLDFAEKFPADFVGRYIDDLTGISDVILFSSQLPVLSAAGKTGQEKYPAHWQRLFEARGFVAIDCIRPQIWKMDDVLLEYKQGMVLYVREKTLAQYPKLLDFYLKHEGEDVLDMVHPTVYKNSANLFQGEVNALMAEVEKLTRKPKKVMYAFYHPMSLAWTLIHKLKMHPSDDVYFLIPRDGSSWRSKEKNEVILKLLKLGFIKGIYTYRMLLGTNPKIESVEKCEKDIETGIDFDFREQYLDIKSFDTIYSGTDAHDTLGIYFSIKKIHYNWFEGSEGGFAFKANERMVKADHAGCIAYRDTLLKHKTLLGANSLETMIVNPKSELPETFNRDKVNVFDATNAACSLSNNDVNLILQIYEMNKTLPPSKNVAMIAPQSYWWTYTIYNRCDYIRKRYKNAPDYGMYAMQIMQDYYSPNNSVVVHKPHPTTYINKDLQIRYFNGVYFYHNLFTLLLMNILPKECRNPKYIIHTISSVNKQFSEEIEKIDCSGVWLFAVFYNKYYIVLNLLSYLQCLGLNTGKKFSGIGKEGDSISYNNMRMVTDIENLIKVQFTKNITESNADFIVQQVNPESIIEESRVRDFLIYTDVWGTLSFELLQKICPQVHTSIIKISKKPIKPLEDILVPLQDEYIFIFSKDVSYIEKLKEFSAVKLNKAMGIELNASMISMEEYAGSHAGK